MTPDELVKRLDDHIVASNVVHKDLANHDQRVAARQDFIIAELFGEAKRDIDGDIVRKGGRLERLEKQVASLYNAQKNGGLKVHVPWGKGAVFVGLIVAILELVKALIERL